MQLQQPRRVCLHLLSRAVGSFPVEADVGASRAAVSLESSFLQHALQRAAAQSAQELQPVKKPHNTSHCEDVPEQTSLPLPVGFWVELSHRNECLEPGTTKWSFQIPGYSKKLHYNVYNKVGYYTNSRNSGFDCVCKGGHVPSEANL